MWTSLAPLGAAVLTRAHCPGRGSWQTGEVPCPLGGGGTPSRLLAAAYGPTGGAAALARESLLTKTKHRLRQEVATLIDLENRNGETLAQVRCRALAEEAELDRSSRQLRQLRSYAPVTRSAWSSYS